MLVDGSLKGFDLALEGQDFFLVFPIVAAGHEAVYPFPTPWSVMTVGIVFQGTKLRETHEAALEPCVKEQGRLRRSGWAVHPAIHRFHHPTDVDLTFIVGVQVFDDILEEIRANVVFEHVSHGFRP